MRAQFTGAAPRYLGSKEAWRLIQPYGGSPSTAGGSRLPYATTTMTSGRSAARASTTAAGRRPRWLQDGQVVLKGQRLDRGCCCLLTPPTWAIRLGDHGDDLVRRGEQRAECGTGKRCRAHEDEAHSVTPAPPLAALPLGALKLADHEITRRRAHAVEKQHALQVVHFVLKGARQ